MTPLFLSWVCDFCDKALPQPSGGDALPVKDVDKPDGYPTGFKALDRITSTAGYPIGAITELFGNDTALLDKCWEKLPCRMGVDLDWRTEDLLTQVGHMLATIPMVGIKVYGGDGKRYADFATGLNDLMLQSKSGVVLFNEAVRTSPLCSVAPRAVKVLASLRIRLMQGYAVVVKSRWGDDCLMCRLP